MVDQVAIEAFPLSWPEGWRRTSAELRTRARFHRSEQRYGDGGSNWKDKKALTVSQAIDRVARELATLGAWTTDTVISTNVPVQRNGMPYSNQKAPADPGVAVYWQKGKARRCIAIDRYDRVQDNLAAIAATLAAMRAIDRHGGAEILDRAFTGFTALPAPEQWFTILGVSSHASRDEIEDAHRRLAMKHHPDRGGETNEMARINYARDCGYEQLSGG